MTNYKDTYIRSYNHIFSNQETKILNALKEFKLEDIYEADHYCKEVNGILFRDIASFEKRYPFYFKKYIEIFEQRSVFKKNPIENVLKLKLKPKFENDNEIQLENFERLIEYLGSYLALIDAKRYYESLYWLAQLYFEFDQIDDFKLEFIEDIKQHPDYIYLTNLKYPISSSKEKLNALTEEKEELKIPVLNNEIDQLIQKLNNDEKILMRSILMSIPTVKKKYIPDTEIARALYITEGVFDTKLFIDESKNITYLKKYTQGLYYHKNLRKRKKLINSIQAKTTELKIDHFRTYIAENFD